TRLDEEGSKFDPTGPQRDRGDAFLDRLVRPEPRVAVCLPALQLVGCGLPRSLGVIPEDHRPARNQREGGTPLSEEGDMVLLLPHAIAPYAIEREAGRQLLGQAACDGLSFRRRRTFPPFEGQVHAAGPPSA